MHSTQITTLATLLLASVASAAVAAPGQVLSPSLCVDGLVEKVSAQEALKHYGMSGAVSLDNMPEHITDDVTVQVCTKGWVENQVAARGLCPDNCYKNCGKLIWPWAIFGCFATKCEKCWA